MTAYDKTWVLALLKGSVEGDPIKHFAATRGVKDLHFPAAQKLGLLTETEIDGLPEIVPTEAGHAFYTRNSLSELPDGRATYWAATGGAIYHEACKQLAEVAGA